MDILHKASNYLSTSELKDDRLEGPNPLKRARYSKEPDPEMNYSGTKHNYSKFIWTKELDDCLCKEVEDNHISCYPPYITKNKSSHQWSKLPFAQKYGQRGTKLSERYYNILSPLANKSALDESEIKIMTAFLSRHRNKRDKKDISWADLSYSFYSNSVSKITYRPANSLKNFYHGAYQDITKEQDPERPSNQTPSIINGIFSAPPVTPTPGSSFDLFNAPSDDDLLSCGDDQKIIENNKRETLEKQASKIPSIIAEIFAAPPIPTVRLKILAPPQPPPIRLKIPASLVTPTPGPSFDLLNASLDDNLLIDFDDETSDKTSRAQPTSDFLTKRSKKFEWTKQLDARLCKEAQANSIAPYPSYISQKEHANQWSKLNIGKQYHLSSVKLSERYYNNLNPFINKSKLSPSEKNIVTKFLSESPPGEKISWTQLSFTLYSNSSSKSTYRPAKSLKSLFRYKKREILKNQSDKISQVVTETFSAPPIPTVHLKISEPPIPVIPLRSSTPPLSMVNPTSSLNFLTAPLDDTLLDEALLDDDLSDDLEDETFDDALLSPTDSLGLFDEDYLSEPLA